MNPIKFNAFLIAAGIASGLTVNTLADNSPLPGIREYQQQITVKCASPEEASRINLTPMPLPDSAKLAFSARWDDSNLKHLDTLATMAANGIKGTCFLNGTNKEFAAEYSKKLLQNGCSIGAHTKTHPSLPAWNANEQFYEIMSVRVERESDSDSILSTMVLPYCQYKNGADPQIQRDIGQSMMNSGFIGAPEPFYGYYEKDLNYPAGTLAESALIMPGDRDVSAEKFHKDMDKNLAQKALMEKNPSMTVGIHSWHTPDGMKKLGELLKEISGRKDWWYCNQNEYAAYRFEANNSKVTKTVNGNDAVFTIKRFTPETLGASVPLWFNLTGGVPPQQQIQGATLRNGTVLEVPHAATEKLPELIAVAATDGSVAKMPFIKCAFSVDEKNIASFMIESTNSESTNSGRLDNIIVTVRSGAGFTPGVFSKEAAGTLTGTRKFSGSVQLTHDAAPRYSHGKPYFVAQFDFTVDGKRCRLYATFRGEAAKNLPLIPAQTVQTFAPIPDGTDLPKMSEPGVSLASFNLKPANNAGADVTSVNAFAFAIPKANLPPGNDPVPLAAVFEFIPVQAGNIPLDTDAAEVYLNGRKLVKDKTWELPAVDGKNRLVLLIKARHVDWRLVNYLFPAQGKIKEFCPIAQ